MKKLLCMVMLLMTGLLQQAYAQDRSISGRVTDRSNGQGLPGATVLVKGTTVGASTNADGSFTLSVPASATTLTFSSVGFSTVEQPISADATYNVSLATDAKELGEVVVTGLATSIKRENLANAVTTISSKELTGSTRAVTVDAAMSGKVVGANISQTSGAPGGGVAVQLRGISTINGSSQPLYIIDGVYAVNESVGNGAGAAAFSGASSGTTRTTQDNPLNRLADLNPNDIESIEVLKGPSAAAIYGTRANAGVIIIRTKRGAAGQTRVSLTQDIGVSKAIRLLGKEDWTPEKIDLFYSGAAATAEKAELAAAQAAGKIYDYEKEVFGNTGFLRNTGLSVSGGTDKTKFFASASTSDEQGIVKKTGFQRNSVRLNLDQKIGNRLDLGVSSNYINSNNRRGYTGNDNRGISLGYTLAYVPSYKELHKDARGIFPDAPTGDNPLAVVERAINEEKTNRFIQSGSAVLRIIDRDNSSLRLTAQGGVDFSNSAAILALPADLQSSRNSPNPGAVRFARNNFLNTNLQAFLIYDWKLFDNSVSLTSQVGTVRLGLNQDLTFSQGVGLAPGPLTPNRGSIITQDAYLQNESDVGFIGQQELNFKDRIIATAGVRFDKSTRNGNPEKLYAFPKASLALNVANFDFWTIDRVNQVKLRAAYGETGGPAFFGATFSPVGNIATGGRGGFLPSTLVGNPGIEPERATELEAGIDLGFLDNRVTLEASVYNKEVKNLVNTFVLAPSTGVTSIRAFPVGDLRNRGIELALGVSPVRSENFTWTTTTQYWLNRSEVTRITVPEFATGSGFGATFGRNYFRLGESPSRWYGSPANATENANNPSFLTRYEDAQPKFQMSFLNSFTVLKSFDISFLLHWKEGGYISNLSQLLQDEAGTTADWSKPSGQGDNLTIGQYRGGQAGRQFIQDGSYVRLREASIYYSLPASIRTSLFKDYVQNIRVGVSGNNLLTFTDYVGYDPEVSNFGATSNFAQVDVAGYPNTRRVFFHLGLDF